jgi:hypothetical protein
VWASAAFILLYPLIESRASLQFVFQYMWKDIKSHMGKEAKFDDIPRPIVGSGEKGDELGMLYVFKLLHKLNCCVHYL